MMDHYNCNNHNDILKHIESLTSEARFHIQFFENLEV